jgi:hypothetical protein
VLGPPLECQTYAFNLCVKEQRVVVSCKKPYLGVSDGPANVIRPFPVQYGLVSKFFSNHPSHLTSNTN